MYKENRISKYEHDVLQENCKTFESLLPRIDHVIFLKRDSGLCLENITKRGRPGEESITVDYLEGEQLMLVPQLVAIFSLPRVVVIFCHVELMSTLL